MTPLQLKSAQRFAKSFLAVFVLTILWENWSLVTPVTQLVERLALDFKYKNFAPLNYPSDKIVFIDVDDYSLDLINKSEGRWPWKRDVWYDTIQLLSFGEPKAILFDILFTENDKKNPDSDQQLADIIKDFPNVSLAMSFESIKTDKPDRLPAAVTPFNIEIENSRPSLNNFGTFSRPYSPLWESLSHVHAVNSYKDADGLFRYTPIFLSYDNQLFPSLSLKALQIYLDNPKMKMDKTNLWLMAAKKTRIPLDNNNQFHFHFYQGDFQKEPFESLYALSGKWKNGQLDPDNLARYLKNKFHNKILILGGSATGLQDLKVTPIHKDYPGALLHAVAISNILEGHFLSRPFAGWHMLLSLFFVALIYFNFVYTTNILWKNLSPALILGLYGFLSIYFFHVEEVDLPLSGPIIFGLLSYGDGLAYVSFVESKQKRKIIGTLSKYLSPEVTQQLVEHGIDPAAEVGSKQELTILFSDVRDFTTLSENIKPEQVVAMLNHYLGQMTHIVFEHKGTLDKFIGDAVMAFWGAPIKDENAPLHAVQTALAMVKELRLINKDFKLKYGLEFQIGIGINTGQVIVGNIGSDRRLDYTVIGDNVNLASRMEGLTKNYGVELIVGDNTYDKIKAQMYCRLIDLVQVKGKKETTRLYEVLATIEHTTDEDKSLVQQYSEAFDSYTDGDFSTAASLFKQILAQKYDGPSKVMLDRCEHLLQFPPENWTGIFKFTSK